MDKINQKKLREILSSISQVKLAYLIGSQKEKRSRKDSDLDLVLIVDEQEIKKFDYGQVYLLVEKAVRHSNLDLRVVTKKTNSPLFLFQVAGGQLLYARDEKERVEFEKSAALFYYNTQHLRNIFHHYLNKRLEKGEYGR
ncbi:nucleotidyltransferase domain-containing protein [Candidatus Shapirobacteria bacterium]|nr:nucleotidyltransferase domain-containing protein [Candidatus Shapirobacteria bacterium]